MPSQYVVDLSHPDPPHTTTQRVIKVLASTNPEQISPGDGRRYKRMNAVGFRAPNTPNGASVYFGFDSVNQPYEVPVAGSNTAMSDPPFTEKLVSDLWLRGAIGDGAIIEFEV